MNRIIRGVSIFIVSVILTIVAPSMAMAATTADVVITASPTYIAITNTPAVYDFGVIVASSTTDTALGTSQFTANNTGNVASNITILVTAANWTGGTGWIHSNTATAGADTAGLKCGTWSQAIDATIVKTTSMDLITNLASANHTKWGLRFYAPTSFGDGVQKTVTVRLTIVQA